MTLVGKTSDAHGVGLPRVTGALMEAQISANTSVETDICSKLVYATYVVGHVRTKPSNSHVSVGRGGAGGLVIVSTELETPPFERRLTMTETVVA
jgi:hypothetical protein